MRREAKKSNTHPAAKAPGKSCSRLPGPWPRGPAFPPPNGPAFRSPAPESAPPAPPGAALGCARRPLRPAGIYLQPQPQLVPGPLGTPGPRRTNLPSSASPAH
ncbi:vegetative cell wall protein gp1-like [Ursus americanus]|uniref:vegetative cell wall protein gp1-like n=1 Tax=Ursus americanus TaxID=9643 RepID=UPI001E67BB7F|nr:vegetative cell wall protein gp1-like [Ursus americanus]XP_045662049.1 vegetative cell wall protein gp1-like [Ursus americanus]